MLTSSVGSTQATQKIMRHNRRRAKNFTAYILVGLELEASGFRLEVNGSARLRLPIATLYSSLDSATASDCVSSASTLACQRVKQLPAGLHFLDTVSPELVHQRTGDFERHHVLDDHTGRRHRTHVTAFIFRQRQAAWWSCQSTPAACASVLIGFMAARITNGWPFVMPASSPPALIGRAHVSQRRAVHLVRIKLDGIVHL